MFVGCANEGDKLAVIGPCYPELGQSLWLREVHGHRDGTPPMVNLGDERFNGELIRRLVAESKINAVHDISDGGLIVAVAEMAMAAGIGVELDAMDTPFAFNESQSRYLVTFPANAPLDRSEVPHEVIGTVGGSTVQVNGSNVSLADLREAHQSFFRDWMES